MFHGSFCIEFVIILTCSVLGWQCSDSCSWLQEEAGYTAEVHAKPEFHGFLIGRGGSNIRELRDRTNTRIVFPGVNDADQELITVVGKRENVDSAVKDLKSRIDSLVSNSLCQLFYGYLQSE